MKVIYIDKELTYLKDMDFSSGNEKSENSSYDSRNGVRCIKISPDGKHLASGDRAGNIRIHETASMNEILKIEAHDAEVLALDYTNDDLGRKLMASASRDRLIHVFDVNRDYNFLQTLDDHSSSITAVRFFTSSHSGLQMVSCGADKSLIFRSLAGVSFLTMNFRNDTCNLFCFIRLQMALLSSVGGITRPARQLFMIWRWMRVRSTC